MYIPKAQAFSAITGSPKEKRSDSSSVPCLLSLSLIPLFHPSAAEAQPSVRHSGRSLTQLSSLLQNSLSFFFASPSSKNNLPELFYRTPFVSFRSFFSKSPCLLLYAPKPPFHNCNTDPDHNIGAAIQPPFNSSHPANLPAKTPHTNQAVLPMQM